MSVLDQSASEESEVTYRTLGLMVAATAGGLSLAAAFSCLLISIVEIGDYKRPLMSSRCHGGSIARSSWRPSNARDNALPLASPRI